MHLFFNLSNWANFGDILNADLVLLTVTCVYYTQMQAMKMMVRWLNAIQGTEHAEKYCTSTLRMLNTVLVTSGDLMEARRIA